MTSVPPILKTMRRTSEPVTRCANCAYRLVPPLLDGGEVKTGSVSDGLKMIRVAGVRVRSRYRRMLADGDRWNRLREAVAEIRIFLCGCDNGCTK